jgi:hypothetical protein
MFILLKKLMKDSNVDFELILEELLCREEMYEIARATGKRFYSLCYAH